MNINNFFNANGQIENCPTFSANSGSYPRIARWGSIVVSIIDMGLTILKYPLMGIKALARAVNNVAGSVLNLLGKCFSLNSNTTTIEDPKTTTIEDPKTTTIEDPKTTTFEDLPDEIMGKIFGNLDLRSLGRVAQVSKQWNKLARDPGVSKRVVYNTFAITTKDWGRWFGKDTVKDEDLKAEYASLPLNIFEIITTPAMTRADVVAGRTRGTGEIFMRTHVLVRIPATMAKGVEPSGNLAASSSEAANRTVGQLTLGNFGQLIKKYFPENTEGYRFLYDLDELRNKPIEASYWVGMSKDILPESRHKSFAVQLTMLAELSDRTGVTYEVPTTLEAVVSVMAYYLRTQEQFGTGTRLFGISPYTVTRCKETLDNNCYRSVVGGFAPAGLRVCSGVSYDDDDIAVAPLRKF